MQYIKNFLRWIGVKEKLDSNSSKPPFVNEGEVWWFYCGENIGTEMCGKGKDFLRPCLLYKKLSNKTFLIVPLSTRIKTGTWYVPLFTEGKDSVACLHQIRSIDYKRLHKKLAQLSESNIQKIQIAFQQLYF